MNGKNSGLFDKFRRRNWIWRSEKTFDLSGGFHFMLVLHIRGDGAECRDERTPIISDIPLRG